MISPEPVTDGDPLAIWRRAAKYAETIDILAIINELPPTHDNQ